MRKFNFYDAEDISDSYIIIGTAREVLNLYKHFYNHCEETGVFPEFCGKPIMNISRMYGLQVDKTNYTFCVINNDTIVNMLLDGIIK